MRYIEISDFLYFRSYYIHNVMYLYVYIVYGFLNVALRNMTDILIILWLINKEETREWV